MATAAKDAPASVREMNHLLERARARAVELEPKLAAALAPVLNGAADRAARTFEVRAADYLHADGRRRRDALRVASLDRDGLLELGAALALTASAPGVTTRSTMIAVYPRPDEAARLAEAEGESVGDLHVTLAFLGEATDEQTAAALEALAPLARQHGPLAGTVGGVGVFGDNGKGAPSILLPDVPGLVELRMAVCDALAGADLEPSRQHGYTAHVTVAYRDGDVAPPAAEAIGEPLHFDALHVVQGDRQLARMPLFGAPALTASANVAVSDVGKEVAKVAERVAPDGGYGDAAWNPDEQAVRWVPADWSSREDVDAAGEAFIEIEGVIGFEALDAESCLPEEEGWEPVYCTSACGGCADALTAAGQPTWGKPAPDEVVNVDDLVKRLRGKTDPVRRAAIATMVKAGVEGAGISFDVTNPLVARVLAQSGSQIVDIAQTTQLNVMRIIAASHDAGLSIPDTAAAIRAGMKDATDARSTLIARTELAGAVNGGSLAAAGIVADITGGPLYKRWLTAPGAPNPRHEDYEGLDGQTVGIDEYFDVGGVELEFPGDPGGPPDEICNCFPAETRVEMLSLRAATRRWHEGDLVEVALASGDVLAATPNHPVLRADGEWTAVGDLEEGDHLVRATLVREGVGAPDVEGPPSEIGEVYRLADAAGVPERVVVRPGDLHGDAARDGEVDVVAIDGSFLVDEEAATDEQVAELGRALAYAASTGGRRPEHATLGDCWGRHWSLAFASSAFVGVGCQGATLVAAHPGEPQIVRGRPAADLEAELSEAVRDDRSADAEDAADREHAFTALVSLEQVVKVDRTPFHGYVYNLDTGVGWYTASGIIAGNCRCTLAYAETPESEPVDVEQSAGG